MRKYLLIVFLVINFCSARAEVVRSCDGNYLARRHGRGQLVVENHGRNIGSQGIDHDVNGGVFSLDNSILVVFGLLKKIDVRNPQVTHLSVYVVKPKIRLVEREVYGGGVYGAAFSVDQKFIVVENQFGIDVINIKKNKAHSYGVMYVPQFKTQHCSKR